jgi:hypothetical protein
VVEGHYGISEEYWNKLVIRFDSEVVVVGLIRQLSERERREVLTSKLGRSAKRGPPSVEVSYGVGSPGYTVDSITFGILVNAGVFMEESRK